MYKCNSVQYEGSKSESCEIKRDIGETLEKQHSLFLIGRSKENGLISFIKQH